MIAPTSHRPHWLMHWQPDVALIATGIAYAFVSNDLRIGPS